MDGRLGLLELSFPIGTIGTTRVRISIWFPLLFILLLYWIADWRLALACGGILFVSVLLHEFAHLYAARKTGGYGHEILMWPFGGLAFAQPARTFVSEVLTPAAGPLTQFIICLMTMPVLFQSEQVPEGAFSLLYLPISGFSDNIVRDLLLVTFSLNWKLLWLNLLPAFPLDGGQILRAILSHRVGSQAGQSLSVRIGLVTGVLLALSALFVDVVFLVFLGWMVSMFAMYEYFQIQIGNLSEETFLGYDFSQGYTGLEEGEDDPHVSRPGFFQRWKAKRAEEKRLRQIEEQRATERRVDELLEKVHLHGMDSLTDDERKFLSTASNRYKTRNSGAGRQES